MSEDQKFAARLRELRQAAGLTQRGLADKAGIAYGAVCALEQSLNGPTWVTVLALAAALGVDCTAFNQDAAPVAADPAGHVPRAKGRPRKASGNAGDGKPKRPKGRPRKGD